MYDFDMKKLLDAFEGDPSELANAFTNQLNKELAARKSERIIKEAANDVSNAWNDFINEYFANGANIPKNYKEEDFYVDGTTIIDIMKTLIELIPAIEKYTSTVEAFNKTLNIAKETGTQARDTFKDTMSEFFDKMGW